ncbi:hypothetical protein H1230_13025 [Paenibacillus sp. 19GGS1-52]|uniref:hypothetical protein n=1 Tax=Paenibacillus sp. 19GGS1-52 TaxID=2758563 RepID=UPI001EFB560E|nr:hypothetical protein [Paenibacillus sp. 19GGS1-52]ULO09606.1 hypothetical protein H1230_13025 [Paenibacillus sp. 19GGS1-52]
MIKPAGRRPRQKHVELSNWFNQLSEENQLMVRRVLTEAVDSALFGLFAVIDGVRTIEDSSDKREVELYYVRGQVKKLINKPDDEDLHDCFNFLTQSE